MGGFSVKELLLDTVVGVDVVEYTVLDTLPFNDEVVETEDRYVEPPFSRGVLVLRGDRLLVRWSLLVSAFPLLIVVLLVVVTTLLVTKDGVEENTGGQRSEGTLVSGIHVLLRGSERQLLKRGRGGFGVLPVSGVGLALDKISIDLTLVWVSSLAAIQSYSTFRLFRV